MQEQPRTPSFADLEGDLDADTVAAPAAPSFLEAQAAYANGNPALAKAQDKCRACGGTGEFRSKFTGRLVGECFRCKGTGSVSRGTNERVEKTRATKARKEAEAAQARADWAAEHQAVIDYIAERAARWDFAQSLYTQFNERGTLSEAQVAAIERCIERDRQRLLDLEARREAQRKTNPYNTGVLDLGKLPEGRYAVPGGDSRLKVLVQRPEAPSKWAGWVFVSDAAEYGNRRKYGRQAPGGTYSGAIVEELRRIAADPIEASAAYGKLTGTCGVCGRHLEDAASVARGIGPICFAKVFG